jgi:N-methylhydantoinase A
MPDRDFTAADAAMIETAFKDRYAQFFGRAVEGPEIEFVTFSVKAQDSRPEGARHAIRTGGTPMAAPASRAVFDPALGCEQETAILPRDGLSPGDRIAGPAVIVEAETSTVVTSPFDVVVQSDGSLLLVRKGK